MNKLLFCSLTLVCSLTAQTFSVCSNEEPVVRLMSEGLGIQLLGNNVLGNSKELYDNWKNSIKDLHKIARKVKGTHRSRIGSNIGILNKKISQRKQQETKVIKKLAKEKIKLLKTVSDAYALREKVSQDSIEKVAQEAASLRSSYRTLERQHRLFSSFFGAMQEHISNFVNDQTENFQDSIENVVSFVDTIFSYGEEITDEFAASALETIGVVWDSVEPVVDDVIDTIQGVAEDASDALQNLAEETIEAVTPVVEEIVETASDTYYALQDFVEETIEAVGPMVEDIIETAHETAHELANNAVDFFFDHDESDYADQEIIDENINIEDWIDELEDLVQSDDFFYSE